MYTSHFPKIEADLNMAMGCTPCGQTYVDTYLCILLVWGCFSWFELQFQLSEFLMLRHTVIFIVDIYNSVLPILWQEFGEGSFLFHHDNACPHTLFTSMYMSHILYFKILHNLDAYRGAEN